MQRRERTRHLIELGGLVQKAGLIDLTADDRAALLGAFLELADRLQGEGGAALVEVWRHRGRGCSRPPNEGLLRLVALVAYLIGGLLIGSTIGRLVLIPIAAVAHVSHAFQIGRRRRRWTPGGVQRVWLLAGHVRDFQVGSGVHGSAHFASELQVKDSLGGAGLIVGRENHKVASSSATLAKPIS